MQKSHLLRTTLSLVLIRALVITAYAQDPATMTAGARPRTPSNPAAAHSRFGAGRGYMGFQSRLEKVVGLTPEQRDVVKGLLAQQHEELRVLREGIQPKYSAIQERTDGKIRELLTPDQQKKFDAFVQQQKEQRSNRRGRAS